MNRGKLSNTKPQLTTGHIETLWRKMVRLYGHRWLSNYGEKDDGTWFRGLQFFTPQQLAIGLEGCITNYPDWPPTLGQFVRLCKPPKIIHAERRALSTLKVPPEITDRYIKQMRAHIQVGAIKNAVRDKYRYVSPDMRSYYVMRLLMAYRKQIPSIIERINLLGGNHET